MTLENFLNNNDDDDDRSDKRKHFDHFTSACADTILHALQVSDKEWLKKDEKDIHMKVFEEVHDIISSVIGNRDMSNYEFEETDYDLIFIATMRKALEIAEGPPIV